MRLIATLAYEEDAHRFSSFLKTKEIPNTIEVFLNKDWGSPNYGSSEFRVWIIDEEDITEAQKWLKLFENNPKDLIFDISPLSIQASNSKVDVNNNFWENQKMGTITGLVLAACCFIFLLCQFSFSDKASANVSQLFTCPAEKALLYDYPLLYEKISSFIALYGSEPLRDHQDLPEEGVSLLKSINETHSWQGIYPVIQKGGLIALRNSFKQDQLFEKIREGQVWRLFTPALLHENIFHLFFNMLWVIVLGKQIEQRLLSKRYIGFILLVGIFSNTAQYLMTGPNFLGYSGVVCGMLGFIWARQHVAPWEGYQLERTTIIFMLFYILGMALLQGISFAVEKSFQVSIAPNIANMAHLAGGLLGYLLGRTHLFSWRNA